MTLAGVNTERLVDDRWITWPAAIMIASMLTLMRSYFFIKLFLVAVFVLVSVVRLALGKARFVLYGRLAWFYVWISLVGVAWVFIGVLHRNNFVEANLAAFRLYVVWSAAFCILYTLLRAGQSLKAIHNAIVLAGILIPLINLVGLFDQLAGSGLISDSVKEELFMIIGFGDGYIQFASNNLISMFVIVPYLLSLQFRTDEGKSNSLFAKLALVLSLVFVALSGRRALWVVVALTPCAILILIHLTGGYDLMSARAKRVLLTIAAGSAVGLCTPLIFPKTGNDVGSIERLREGFSSDDERTVQLPYLINGFLKSPIWGSGFGAYAGYTRSDEQPWMYELTYFQMVFNLGAVGVAVLGGLFSYYFVRVVRLLREFKHGSAIPFGLLVAFCGIVAGAYSNPYFSGFDSLFFAGLLAYLSTFQRGFPWRELPAKGAARLSELTALAPSACLDRG